VRTEGDTVRAGDTLAVLTAAMAAQVAAQTAEAERAQSQARDLQQGARPAELTIAREALRAAEADLDQAQITYERTDKLYKANVAAAAEMDLARTSLRAAEARAAGAREQLRLFEEGYRRSQVAAANQGATAALAQLAGAQSRARELPLTAAFGPRAARELPRRGAGAAQLAGAHAGRSRFAVDARVRGRATALTRLRIGPRPKCGRSASSSRTRVTW
jgi:multidrug resistance efflux pump